MSVHQDRAAAAVDHVDDFVDEEYSITFKVAYAYGLRRREVVKLEISDFVLWAKGTKGSGPRRRTVLTVPEFSWVVDQLEYWLSPAGCGQFATADRTDSTRFGIPASFAGS